MSDLNFAEGTATLLVKVNQSPNATKFDFFEYRTNEGEISLKLRNRDELKFTHKYKDIQTVLVFSFADYFDRHTHITVTWNTGAKELKLYIDDRFKKTERII